MDAAMKKANAIPGCNRQGVSSTNRVELMLHYKILERKTSFTILGTIRVTAVQERMNSMSNK